MPTVNIINFSLCVKTVFAVGFSLLSLSLAWIYISPPSYTHLSPSTFNYIGDALSYYDGYTAHTMTVQPACVTPPPPFRNSSCTIQHITVASWVPTHLLFSTCWSALHWALGNDAKEMTVFPSVRNFQQSGWPITGTSEH